MKILKSFDNGIISVTVKRIDDATSKIIEIVEMDIPDVTIADLEAQRMCDKKSNHVNQRESRVNKNVDIDGFNFGISIKRS